MKRARAVRRPDAAPGRDASAGRAAPAGPPAAHRQGGAGPDRPAPARPPAPEPGPVVRALLDAALAHHRAGRLPQAEEGYRAVLALAPDDPDALHLLGVLAHQLGRHDVAVELIGKAVARNGRVAAYQSNLGVALQALGRQAEGVAALERAVALDPAHLDARYNLATGLQALGRLEAAVRHYRALLVAAPGHATGHYNLGNALRALGRHAEAAASYRAALALDGANARAHDGLGVALSEAGRLDEAVESFRTALALAPDDATARLNLGAALQRLGRHEEAVEQFRAAIALAPDRPEGHLGLGLVLDRLGRPDEAVAACERALALAPDDPAAHFGRGAALQNLGRSEEAIVAFTRALDLDPRHLGARVNLGVALEALGRHDEALAACERALAIAPDDPDAHRLIGDVYRELGRRDEAYRHIRRALALRPDFADAEISLGTTLWVDGDADGAVAAYRRAIASRPDLAIAHANLVFVRDLQPATTLAEAYAERRRFQDAYGPALAAHHRPHANVPDPERRLRVGYVSADFRRHSAAYAFLPVLTRHDPAAVEVTCYSGGREEDELTERFRAAAARWRRIVGLSDARLAELVRADEIDILVDLSGFTSGTRLTAFMRKPAPVQVTAWGYATGTGLDAIDYFLADRVTVPPVSRRYYAEEIVELPAVIPYEPPAYAPDVAPSPALARGHVTFGSFNRAPKLTADALRAWARILAAVPSSRLVFKGMALDSEDNQARIRAIFGAAGVDPGRIAVLGATDHRGHLDAYGEVDIALDPFPQVGGITTLEGLLMGVPTLTLLGERVPERVSASFLVPLGLEDFVTESVEAYVARAVALAADAPRLARLRAELRDRLLSSEFGDGARYTRAVEAAYRAMWRRWCAEQ